MALAFNPDTGNYYDDVTGEYYNNQDAATYFGPDATATPTDPYGNPSYASTTQPTTTDTTTAATTPAATSTTTPTTAPGGYSGPNDFGSIVSWWRQQHPASAPDIPGLVSLLKTSGFDVSQATHAGGALSDDKIIYNGQTYDLGSSLGGADGYWFSDLNPMGDSGTVTGFSDWFAANAPQTSGAVEPYTAPTEPDTLANGYTVPTRPASIADAYVAPQFTAPTYQDLLNDPGYLSSEAAIQRGLERTAAAKGTLLSGGFIGRAEPRALAEFAQNAYGNLYNNRLNAFNSQVGANSGARSLNENAYQGDVSNAMGAFTANNNAFQNRVTNSLNQYNTRYRAYQDALNNQFKLADLGLRATTAGAPA